MRLLSACLAAATFGLCVLAPASAEMYYGSLAYSPPAPADADDGLLMLGNKWPTFSVTFEWEVTDEDDTYLGYPWKYTYTFSHSGNQAGLSHIIVECSDGVSSDDIKGLTVATIESVGLQKEQSGNPDMPEDIIGIRFNPPEGTSPFSMTWSFWTNRAPVWGDFFAKDGGSNVGYNYNKDAYDVEHGFLDLDNNNTVRDDPDPAVAPSNGSVDSHILRPDSLVPEPCALGMLATGAAGLMICLLRRRRHT